MGGRSILAATAFGIGLAVSTIAVAQSSGGSEGVPVEAVGADVSHPQGPSSPDDLRAALRSGSFLANGWQLLREGKVVTAETGTAQNSQPGDEQEYPRVRASDLEQWTRDQLAAAADQPPVKGIEGEAFLYGPVGEATFDSWLAVKVYAKGVDVALPPGGLAVETATELMHVIPMGPDAPPAAEVVEGLGR